MARLNFKEISSANKAGGDQDQFEKFCKEFIEQVIGWKVYKGPSRGADGGIDLGAEDKSVTPHKKWLVSCKHYSHSGNAVGRGDEEDILDRKAEHGCDGFVGIYSTIASTGLEQKLERLKTNRNLDYKLYNSEDIESLLLSSLAGFNLAKRYFPNSIQNVWPQVISLNESYNRSDVIQLNGKWKIPKAERDGMWPMSAASQEEAVRLANEYAMLQIHAPMFLGAWKDAVKLYPGFFNSPAAGIESATSVKELAPKWEESGNIKNLTPQKRWGLLAIWSLSNVDKASEIVKSLGAEPEKVLSFEHLSLASETERRDVLTRLFAYRSTT